MCDSFAYPKVSSLSTVSRVLSKTALHSAYISYIGFMFAKELTFK